MIEPHVRNNPALAWLATMGHVVAAQAAAPAAGASLARFEEDVGGSSPRRPVPMPVPMPVPPPAPGAVTSMARVVEIQQEALAWDLPVRAEMTAWGEGELRAYFEGGGTTGESA